MINYSQDDLNQLFDIFSKHFNADELATLCFKAQIDFNELPGGNFVAKVRELIKYLSRHQQVSAIVTQGQKDRPELDWLPLDRSPPVPPPVPIIQAPPAPALLKPSVFISYSKQDDPWKNRMITHLGILKHQGLLAPWSDQESLEVGQKWYPTLINAIEQARIALLLVSPNFLNSEFILKEEIPRFLTRSEKGELLIYPVVCKPCAWQVVEWLSQMQVRPRRGQPLSLLSEEQQETVLAEIAVEVYQKLKE